MNKTILLTGGTDGIGLETAKNLVKQGHTLLLHGRNSEKLQVIKSQLEALNSNATIESYQADLANLSEVLKLANAVRAAHDKIDVLINNAGVFKTPKPVTDTGYDIRFMVNTLAPLVLTQQLLPAMNKQGRVLNLSSAAQAPVSLNALSGKQLLSDSSAYAQSKLAITMWSFYLAEHSGSNAPAILAINPASFLGSKMVKDAYGSEGKDLSIGADILVRAALSEEFNGITGRYFDNDIGNWAQPHPDALNEMKNNALMATLQDILKKLQIPTID